jgi:DNA primase
VEADNVGQGLDAQGMMSQAGKLQLDVRVLQLPNGKDPDDFIRTTPNEWPEVVNRAKPLVDYVIEMGTRSLSSNADIHERERLARELLPLLTATESDLQRNDNIQRLATRLHIHERDLILWARGIGNKPATLPNFRRPQPNGGGNGNYPRNNGGFYRPNGQNGHPHQPGIAIERYCLSMLLQNPNGLFNANRKLRELATSHEQAASALVPLGQDDFSREDYRALFRLIDTALEQDSLEPTDFIQEQLPPELMGTVEEIQPQPLEGFRQRASMMHLTELHSVIKDLSRFSPESNHQTAELFRCILELRQQRLKREMNDFYFFEREFQLDDNEVSPVDYVKIKAHSLAIQLLERARHELVHQRQDSL